jgi:hypothetical protein
VWVQAAKAKATGGEVPDIPDYVPVSALSLSEDEAPKAKPAAKAAKPKAGKAPPKDVVAASKKPTAADRQAQKDEILAAARAKALAAAQ